MSSEVRVIVTLGTSAIQTGLTKIKAQFSQFRSDLNSTFSQFLAFGSIAEGLRRMVEQATEFANVSKRFDVPVEDLQRVANAAKVNGASIEDVARSWNKLAVNQQKAIDGNDEMRKVFEDLKIPMTDVVNLDVGELFLKIADSTQAATDRGAAYADVFKLMGRNAGTLFSTLQEGSAEIKRVGDNMGVMSAESVEGLHRIHTAFEFLWGKVREGFGEAIVFFNRLFETWVAGEDLFLRVFETIGSVVVDTARMLKSLVTGDIQNFDWGTYKKNFQNLSKDIVAQAEIAKRSLDAIWTPVKEPEHRRNPNPVDREVPESSGEIAKQEHIKELKEQLAEIDRKNANDQLTIQEKINALVAQRLALLKEAAGTKDEEKKIQLEIDAAKIETEITAAVKERTRFIEQADKEQEREEEQRKRDEGHRIAANSLRRIGGQETGGFAVGGIDDKLLREQTAHRKILETIEHNTRPDNRQLLMR